MPKDKNKDKGSASEETTTEGGEEGAEKTREILIRHKFELPEKDKGKDGNPTGGKEKEGTEGGEEGEAGSKKDDKTKKPLTVEELQAKLDAEKKLREDAEAKATEFSSIIETEAVKAFENEKNTFLGLIPDENKRKAVAEKIGDDPEILEEYQRMTVLLGTSLTEAGVKVTGTEEQLALKLANDKKTLFEQFPNAREKIEGIEKPEDLEALKTELGVAEPTTDDAGGAVIPPSVPSGLPAPPSAGEGAKNWKQYADGLYAILLDPKKSRAEKKEADQMVNELFTEFVKGFRASGGKTKISISQCPKCGALLTGGSTECEICGWKHGIKIPSKLR